MDDEENFFWNEDDNIRYEGYKTWFIKANQEGLAENIKYPHKRKIPIFIFRKRNLNKIGWYSLSSGSDPICHWCIADGSKKSFKLSELCERPELENDRYEFGMLVAVGLDNFSQLIRRLFGDSTENINFQAKCSKSAADFKHWAEVPAGHMIFPKDRQ